MKCFVVVVDVCRVVCLFLDVLGMLCRLSEICVGLSVVVCDGCLVIVVSVDFDWCCDLDVIGVW